MRIIACSLVVLALSCASASEPQAEPEFEFPGADDDDFAGYASRFKKAVGADAGPAPDAKSRCSDALGTSEHTLVYEYVLVGHGRTRDATVIASDKQVCCVEAIPCSGWIVRSPPKDCFEGTRFFIRDLEPGALDDVRARANAARARPKDERVGFPGFLHSPYEQLSDDDGFVLSLVWPYSDAFRPVLDAVDGLCFD